MAEATKPQETKEEIQELLLEKLKGQNDLQSLQTIMEELAEESDALKKLRKHLADSPGEELDASVAGARRVIALKEIASLVMERNKLGQNVNLEHPVIKVAMDYVFTVLEKVLMSNGLVKPQVDVIFTHMSKALKDWKEEVSKRLAIEVEKATSSAREVTKAA